MSDRSIAILGSGAWGTALALVCARAGHAVRLWGRTENVVEKINHDNRNPDYLPGIGLKPGLIANLDLDFVLEGAETILIVTPAQTMSEMGSMLSERPADGSAIICCAKGIDRQTGLLPHQTLSRHLPDKRIAALSGPSFAADVARDLPTAVTIASDELAFSRQLAELLSTSRFRCYASADLLGVELGGALKNVIALAVGATRGMQLGASAEAALIARGFAEMTRLSVALGAQRETLSGLSGLGDLVLTCSSEQSRNFSFGLALGSGQSVENLPLAEGAFTAAIAAKIAEENHVNTPVISAVGDVLRRKITPREAVEQLLDRPLAREGE